MAVTKPECIVKKHSPFLIFESITLLVLFAGIIFINFSHTAHLYCTDMYTDMVYATEVWETGSVFPDGWVFGNQFYVVATPVLSSLFYGLTGDAMLSMSIASTVMALLVIVSFVWMIVPVVRDMSDRLLACALFIMLPLIAGDAAVKVNGWQLLFTLCSYYACYAITVFLAFGLYVRLFSDHRKNHCLLLPIVLFLSFCTGMQSLRQTLIMVIPLLVFEFCNAICRLIRKRPISGHSLILTGLISASNFLGVLAIRFVELNQVEIFGKMQLDGNVRSGIENMNSNIHDLLGTERWNLLLSLFVAAIAVSALLRLLLSGKKSNHSSDIVLGMLLSFSVLAVGAVDVFTTMSIRSIYYFMVYPLLAYWAARLLELPLIKSRSAKQITACLMLLVFGYSAGLNYRHTLKPTLAQKQASYEQIAADLTDQHITTVYSQWNVGEKIAIASDMTIDAGFWNYNTFPFREVRYLCNPEVFDHEDCAYVFRGVKTAELALQIVEENGYQMTLLDYYPETDIYVYTSPYDLVDLID